jgi:arsenite-transporting ATPase
LTTFVCVCIPEFLSLYETERLVQELGKFSIDSHTIIINQILFPERGGNCSLCKSREAMQQKYISQLELLYTEFHIVKMPLMKEEIRGVEKLNQFSSFLKVPFVPNQ